MNKELHEAIQRRRDNPGWQGMHYPYPTAVDDAIILADAYLAEHPVDEDELATVEWMESIGFVKTHPFAWRFGQKERLYFHHDANITQFGVEGAFHRKDPNRGDVRQLCKALGIDLP